MELVEKIIADFVLLAQQDPAALLALAVLLMVTSQMLTNVAKLPGAIKAVVKRRRLPPVPLEEVPNQLVKAISDISQALTIIAPLLATSQDNQSRMVSGIDELNKLVANNTRVAENQFSSLTQQSALIQAFAEKQGLSLAAIQGQQTTLIAGAATLQQGVTTVEQKIDDLGDNVRRVEDKVNGTAATLKTSHDEIMKRLNDLPAAMALQLAPELKTWELIGQKIDELGTLLEKATADLLTAIDRVSAKAVPPPATPPPDPLVQPLTKPDPALLAPESKPTDPEAKAS